MSLRVARNGEPQPRRLHDVQLILHGYDVTIQQSFVLLKMAWCPLFDDGQQLQPHEEQLDERAWHSLRQLTKVTGDDGGQNDEDDGHLYDEDDEDDEDPYLMPIDDEQKVLRNVH